MEHKDEIMTTTKTVSKGEPTLTQAAQTAAFAWTPGAPRTAYSTGKTISLGDYQFARVGVRIEVEHTEDTTASALETTRYLAREITEQEAASVKNEEREARPFNDGGFTKFEVSLEYGLTLKTGRFDSAKVDIALTRHVDGNLADVIANMRSILKDQVMIEAKDIKG